MIVHSLPLETQRNYLKTLGVLFFKSSRIGYFVEASRIDEKIVSDLNLTASFEFNDEQTDENNVIVMLPTDLALQIKALFKKCYLVCTEETFVVMLPNYIVEGISVPNPIAMTIVEFKELDEEVGESISDLQYLKNIVANYESQHPLINGKSIKKINFPYVFYGRNQYRKMMADKLTSLRFINTRIKQDNSNFINAIDFKDNTVCTLPLSKILQYKEALNITDSDIFLDQGFYIDNVKFSLFKSSVTEDDLKYIINEFNIENNTSISGQFIFESPQEYFNFWKDKATSNSQ